SASSNPAPSSISSTNGPCAPASTRRKRSTSPRSRKSARYATRSPPSGATSARPAISARASRLPSAPKAHTFAALRSGSTSPPFSVAYDSPRQPRLLPCCLDPRNLLHEPAGLDQKHDGRDRERGIHALRLRPPFLRLLRTYLRRGRRVSWRISSSPYHGRPQV